LEPETSIVDEIFEDDGVGLSDPWQTVLYNCNCHSYDQVIQALRVAISCTLEEAFAHAWTVDHHGQASVYRGEHKECERVMGVLVDAGLRAEVEEL
jgi:hypothetical protein